MGRNVFRRKSFYFILIGIMLIFGICPSQSKTDSLFQYAKMNQVYPQEKTSCYLNSNELDQREVACLDESLCARSIGSIQTGRRLDKELCSNRTIIVYSYMAIQPLNTTCFNNMKLQQMQAIGICCNNRIISYIHQMDGAKG